MAKRSQILELAVLGLLHESPMHGYELRKRLNAALGAFRALSYGTLYPCLKDLVARGWIDRGRRAQDRRRARRHSPAAGQDRLQADRGGQGAVRRSCSPTAGPGGLGGRATSASTSRSSGGPSAAVRLRILEGRRTRLEERLEQVRGSLARSRERLDSYTLELQQHGLESVEREVRWLNELIETEHDGDSARSRPPPLSRGPTATARRASPEIERPTRPAAPEDVTIVSKEQPAWVRFA